MSFFDVWKTLNERFDEGDMTAQTQLVGYKLFAIFNERKFPEWLPLTDRELMSRTNIKSGQTIVAARRQLKNAGLIDFATEKNKPTRYRLAIQSESSTNQATIKHESSTNQATGGSSYIRVCEDVLDVKTYSSLTSTRARAQAGAPVNEEAEPAEDLARYWSRTLGGARLSFEDISWLDSLVQKHGYEWTKGLLDEAYNSNGNTYGLSPKWLKLVYAGRQNPPKSEGGRKREQSHRPAAGRRYDLSGTDREPDWLKGSGSKTQGAFGGDNAANLQTIRR